MLEVPHPLPVAVSKRAGTICSSATSAPMIHMPSVIRDLFGDTLERSEVHSPQPWLVKPSSFLRI